MSIFDDNKENRRPPLRAQNVPDATARRKADKVAEAANKDSQSSGSGEPFYSLNDDRRVKVLSPGALVAKRFFRNRLAVVGLSILIFMFLFSFVGGLVSPYAEDEFFYRDESINKEFAAVTENTEFRYMAKDSSKFGSPVQAQTMLAIQKGLTGFSYGGNHYTMTQEGADFYAVSSGDTVVGIAYKDIVNSSLDGQKLDFDFVYAALKAYAARVQEGTAEEPAPLAFTAAGTEYTIEADGSVLSGTDEVAYISRYIVQAIMPDVFLSRDFKEKLIDTIAAG